MVRGDDAWKWRRMLFVWEGELVVECSGFLSNVVLQDNMVDR